jgi:hypothetical protein
MRVESSERRVDVKKEMKTMRKMSMSNVTKRVCGV